MNTTLINEKKRELDLTNYDIALKTKIPLSTVSKICSGNLKTTSKENLSKIGKVLGCSIDELEADYYTVEPLTLSKEEEVRELILARYGSLTKFAEIVKLSPSTISRIFREGFNSATLEKVKIIFDELNLSIDTMQPKELKKENKLGKNEEKILKMLRTLSAEGIEKAETYVKDLNMIDKYKKKYVLQSNNIKFHIEKDAEGNISNIKIQIPSDDDEVK